MVSAQRSNTLPAGGVCVQCTKCPPTQSYLQTLMLNQQSALHCAYNDIAINLPTSLLMDYDTYCGHAVAQCVLLAKRVLRLTHRSVAIDL